MVRSGLLQELREHCKSSGISLVDWMESAMLEWKAKHGRVRTAQLNIKMLPAVKERLMAYCESQGIAVTDWMEEIVMSLGEN